MALQDADFSWTKSERQGVSNTKSRLLESAAEYFAYVALIGLASAAAVLAIVFSANVAVTWLDHVSSPGFFGRPAEVSSPMDETYRQQHMRGAAFAMLPASVPLKIRNDVIASDF